jgi:hypothetical protein
VDDWREIYWSQVEAVVWLFIPPEEQAKILAEVEKKVRRP